MLSQKTLSSRNATESVGYIRRDGNTYIQRTEIAYNYIYTYTVAGVFDTYESHGTTYDDVMKMTTNISLSYMGTEMANTNTVSYYALNIGSIETGFGEYGSQFLTSHSLN